MLVLSTANSRKDALRRIESYQTSLAVLIAQIYIYGDSPSLKHWTKELRAVLLNIGNNTLLKKGSTLSTTDIVAALDQIALPASVRLVYQDLASDPDYSSLVERRPVAYTASHVTKLLGVLALLLLDVEVPAWKAAELLVSEILSW